MAQIIVSYCMALDLQAPVLTISPFVFDWRVKCFLEWNDDGIVLSGWSIPL